MATVVQPTQTNASATLAERQKSLKTDPPSIALLPLVSQSNDSDMRALTESIDDDLMALTSHRPWRVVGGRSHDLDLEPEVVGRQRNVHYLLFGIDVLIDPAKTRRWIADGLMSVRESEPLRRGRRRFLDTW